MKTYLPEPWEKIAACVDRYEEDRPTSLTELRRFVEGVAPENQAEALLELAVIDLEFRWTSENPKRVEDYLIQFPELRGLTRLTDDLIRHEYYVRRRHGEEPPMDEYRRRFPDTDVEQVLEKHDSSVLNLEPDDATEERADNEREHESVNHTLPESIGRYQVRESIGSGAFGQVYRCLDPKLNREVAVKLPRSDKAATSPESVLFEARSAARLRHPGIVAVMDADQLEDGRVYIVYEYVPGQSLKQRIASGDISREQAVEWCRQVALALHHAHKQGIVHRDVKPANVLIDPQGNTRLADFGLARMDDQFSQDDHGKIVGSLAYMSPEQARGDSQWASAQTDIYALGVMLYELLTGRKPFGTGGAREILEQIQRRDPVPPRAIDDSIPLELEQVCLKALAKRASDRYSTASDMAMALHKSGSPVNWLRPQRPLMASLVLALAVIAATVQGMRPSNPSAISTPPNREDVRPDSGDPQLDLWIERIDRHGHNQFHIARRMAHENRFLQDGDSVAIKATLPVEEYVYLFAYYPNGTMERLYPNDTELSHQTRVRSVWLPPQAGLATNGSMDSMRFRVKADGGHGTEMILLATSDKNLTGPKLADFERYRYELNLPFDLESDVYFLPLPETDPSDALRGFPREKRPEEQLLGKEFFEQLTNRFTSFRAVIYQHHPTPDGSREF